MSSFNSPSNFNTPSAPKTSSRKALPFIVGGVLLTLFCGIGNLAGSARGHQTNQTPMTAQYNNDRSFENGETGSNDRDAADQDTTENGNSSQGNNGPEATGMTGTITETTPSPADQSPSNQDPETGGDATDNGYAERERVQDQAAQANDGNIRGTDTVRDTDNGQVYTDVPNDQADSAIQSGAATEVPTAELPTSEDAGAASAPDTSATDTPAAE